MSCVNGKLVEQLATCLAAPFDRRGRTQSWLDYKEKVKKEGLTSQERSTPGGQHLLHLISQHKGNATDLISQIRTVNKGIEVMLTEARDIITAAQEAAAAGLVHVQEDTHAVDSSDIVRSLAATESVLR